jgi:hypothetical protein
MQSQIVNSGWYKNFTKGFIDTTPPPGPPKKKMPLKQDILIRSNKMIDIGFITTIYFIFGAIVANVITNFQTKFNSDEEDKKTLIRSSLDLIVLIWINGVLIYFARNLVEMIPYPFDNYFGFEHKRVKELSGATAFTFVLLYYQPNLNNIMKYLSARWKNTFSGRSTVDGIKLLFKPAPIPTNIASTPLPGKPSVNTQASNKQASNTQVNSKQTINKQ